jgi:MOSC domain-containing protein YiiM
VRISAAAVADDAICNTEHHGGTDQAVYAYCIHDYDWWARELGRELHPGTFGENLTILDMPTDLYVGDRLVIGDAVLEATSPRIPCNTLAAVMGDSKFGLKFRKAERPGIYFRVLNEGQVSAGDRVELVPTSETIVSIVELFRLAFEPNPDVDILKRYLEAPLATRMRTKLEGKLSVKG